MYFTIGQEWKYTNSSDEQMDDLYINNFKMVDLVTETIFQSSLSIWVLKSYGYEDKIQLISLGFSYISQYKSYVDRFAFTRYHNATLCQIFGTWTEWLFLILTDLVITFFEVSDESTPPWQQLAIFAALCGTSGLMTILKFLFPNKIFESITNWFFKIPVSYTMIFPGLFGYAKFYWRLLVIAFLTGYLTTDLFKMLAFF